MASHLNIKQAADKLKVSEKTLRRQIKAGRISAQLIEGPKGLEYQLSAPEVARFSKDKKQEKVAKSSQKKSDGKRGRAYRYDAATEDRILTYDNIDYKKLFEDLLSRHEQAMVLMGKLQGELGTKVPLLEERASSLNSALEEKDKAIMEITSQLEIIRKSRAGLVRRFFRIIF